MLHYIRGEATIFLLFSEGVHANVLTPMHADGRPIRRARPHAYVGTPACTPNKGASIVVQGRARACTPHCTAKCRVGAEYGITLPTLLKKLASYVQAISLSLKEIPYIVGCFLLCTKNKQATVQATAATATQEQHPNSDNKVNDVS